MPEGEKCERLQTELYFGDKIIKRLYRSAGKVNLRDKIQITRIYEEYRPLQRLADPLDQMLIIFAAGGVLEDLHLEISVQRAQEVFSSILSNISVPSHFEPAFIQYTLYIKSLDNQWSNTIT